MVDVLVIGGGLAGATAALAAKQGGARVALASRSWGATALSTGALDIAFGPAASSTGPAARTLAEHMADIAAHRTRHPYAVMGLTRSRDAIARAYALVTGALEGAGLAPSPLRFDAENLALPSSLGAAVPAAAALAPHTGVDFAKPATGTLVVAQLEGDASFDARRVAAGIMRDAEALTGTRPMLEVVPVASPGRGTPLMLAQLLDDLAHTEELARALERRAAGAAGVIMPPVLGLTRAAAVRARLAEVVRSPIFEALGHVPSVPGVRLQKALDAAVAAQGITRLGEVGAPEVQGGAVRSVALASGERIVAQTVVLATGRFIAGGVEWTDRCREALFGLPVMSELGPMEEDSPSPVVRESPMESHPLMTTGIAVSRKLQPLAEGRVALSNVFAAGMVIGGFASRYALCADGVALASGWLAAQAALGQGSRT